MSDRVRFVCDGVGVDADARSTLLTVLREQLAKTSVKDGCAPQGQCGCCTVLVDGEPRVACVTPVARVAGREVTTPEGLDREERDEMARAFVATGGSQCGFCTPGIVMRAVAARRQGRALDDRGLAAHLCRCTGWVTVCEAARGTEGPVRDADAASARATLEGGPQRVGDDVPLGGGGFADDTAPGGALVAVPLPPGSAARFEEAVGARWVIAENLADARAVAGKVQGRRTGSAIHPPLAVPDGAEGAVRLATSWVEPAYLEPDASWCLPGGEPATPLANGGAFGGKEASLAPLAARELADRLGRAVRVVYSREDVVRLGPKRPPMAAAAHLAGRVAEIRGVVAGDPAPYLAPVEWPYECEERGAWEAVAATGPPTSAALRAVGIAERACLLEAALDETGADRRSLARDGRVAATMLDTCAPAGTGALAGARIVADESGVRRVEVRVAAGDPLDETIVRSYAIGAAHMALGWVCSEGLAVDDDGIPLDLTIRSFGVIRAAETPPIDVHVVDEPGPPLARSSDAVFAAVAAAMWNAIARDEGSRPDSFPARATRLARSLRR